MEYSENDPYTAKIPTARLLMGNGSEENYREGVAILCKELAAQSQYLKLQYRLEMSGSGENSEDDYFAIGAYSLMRRWLSEQGKKKFPTRDEFEAALKSSDGAVRKKAYSKLYNIKRDFDAQHGEIHQHSDIMEALDIIARNVANPYFASEFNLYTNGKEHPTGTVASVAKSCMNVLRYEWMHEDTRDMAMMVLHNLALAHRIDTKLMQGICETLAFCRMIGQDGSSMADWADALAKQAEFGFAFDGKTGSAKVRQMRANFAEYERIQIRKQTQLAGKYGLPGFKMHPITHSTNMTPEQIAKARMYSAHRKV